MIEKTIENIEKVKENRKPRDPMKFSSLTTDDKILVEYNPSKSNVPGLHVIKSESPHKAEFSNYKSNKLYSDF